MRQLLPLIKKLACCLGYHKKKKSKEKQKQENNVYRYVYTILDETRKATRYGMNIYSICDSPL